MLANFIIHFPTGNLTPRKQMILLFFTWANSVYALIYTRIYRIYIVFSLRIFTRKLKRDINEVLKNVFLMCMS